MPVTSTQRAAIRALVQAAEALPLDIGADDGQETRQVIRAAYALRRAKDEPKTRREACPRCARVLSVRGKYMRDHRDALGDGWCYRVEVGS